MVPKDSKRKASKGSVQIKSSNGRLQLVFTFGEFNPHMTNANPVLSLLQAGGRG